MIKKRRENRSWKILRTEKKKKNILKITTPFGRVMFSLKEANDKRSAGELWKITQVSCQPQ